jgi:hypothetical protein
VTGAARSSTLIIAGVFVAALVVYLLVRPEPAPPVHYVRAPVETVPPRATTSTTRPRATTTTEQPSSTTSTTRPASGGPFGTVSPFGTTSSSTTPTTGVRLFFPPESTTTTR